MTAQIRRYKVTRLSHGRVRAIPTYRVYDSMICYPRLVHYTA